MLIPGNQQIGTALLYTAHSESDSDALFFCILSEDGGCTAGVRYVLRIVMRLLFIGNARKIPQYNGKTEM